MGNLTSQEIGHFSGPIEDYADVLYQKENRQAYRLRGHIDISSRMNSFFHSGHLQIGDSQKSPCIITL